MISEHIILQSAGSLSVAILALLMVIVQALFFFRKPQFPWYAWSAAISFSALLYSIGIFLEYNTAQGPINRCSGLLEWTAILFLIHCLYGFSFSYLGIASKRYHQIAGVFHGLVLILLWSTDYLVAHRFTAQNFIGLESPYIEPALGPLGPSFVLYGAAASVTAMIIWIRHKRTDPKYRITYLAGLGVWTVLGIHDGLASLGVPTLQYLMEYGFLGFAMAVLWVVFNNYSERVAEEQYRVITEFANDCILVIQDEKIVFGNPACCDLIGQPFTDSSLKEFLDLMVSENRKMFLGHCNTLLQGGRVPTPHTARIKRADGEQRFVEIASRLIQYRNRPAVLAGLHDITESKQAEEALRVSEEGYRELANSITDVFFAMDENLKYVYWNKASEELTGIPEKEAIGKSLYEVFPDTPQTRRAEKIYRDVLRTQQSQTFINEYQFGDKDVFFEISAYPSARGLSVFAKDITEQRQAEQEKEKLQTQLQRALKMEAIGRLTAGVAHEILNPVNIISLRLQLVKKAEDLSDRTKKALDICTSQLNRITEIIKELGQFSHISKEHITMSDLNTVIGHVLTLYEPQLKVDNIKTDIQFYPDLPKIPLDQDRLGQVIFNIIANASDAMAEQENKMLRIITKPAASQDYTQVIISDTGTGIDRSDMDKIFEPYFTTKDKPQDTGLGLFISYKIIQDHGGRIWAENNEWGGASFFIELPVLRDTKS
jgi:PAS domain S-box-containing protein